jgi:hypothetical protein
MTEFKNTDYEPRYPNLPLEDNTQVERLPGNDDIVAEARDYNIVFAELLRIQQYLGFDLEGDWVPGSETVFDLLTSQIGSIESLRWLEPSGSNADRKVVVRKGVYYVDPAMPPERLSSDTTSPEAAVPASGSYRGLLHIDEFQSLAWEYGSISVSGVPVAPDIPVGVMPIYLSDPISGATTDFSIFDPLENDARPFLNLGGSGGGAIDAYLKSEHVNISAGVADAGKPVVLDPSGLINESMIFGAGVDADPQDFNVVFGFPQTTFFLNHSAKSKESVNIYRNGKRLHKNAYELPFPTQLEILLTDDEPDPVGTNQDETITADPRTAKVWENKLEDLSVVTPGDGPALKSLNSVSELLTRGDDGHLYIGDNQIPFASDSGNSLGGDYSVFVDNAGLGEVKKLTTAGSLRPASSSQGGGEGLVDVGVGNLSADIAVSGTNGRITGLALTDATWYALTIFNDSTGTNAAIIHWTSGSPTMPAGYDRFSHFTWAYYIDATDKFIGHYENNGMVIYVEDNSIGTFSGNFAAVSVADQCPDGTLNTFLGIYVTGDTTSGGANVHLGDEDATGGTGGQQIFSDTPGGTLGLGNYRQHESTWVPLYGARLFKVRESGVNPEFFVRGYMRGSL